MKDEAFFTFLVVLWMLIFLFCFVLLGSESKKVEEPNYKYAQFISPSGQLVDGKLVDWKEVKELVQVEMEDGKIYLVDKENLVLSEEEIAETEGK